MVVHIFSFRARAWLLQCERSVHACQLRKSDPRPCYPRYTHPHLILHTLFYTFYYRVVVCQPIVPAVDVLIFSLQFSNVIPDGTFKVTGTVFFLIVVAIEMVYNLATLRELMRIYQGQSAASLEVIMSESLLRFLLAPRLISTSCSFPVWACGCCRGNC